ncbi:MAG: uroporphyrin-III C/tetrapyrrole (Corrin/Porphyrin) methyltransferase, rRNA [Candidatus Parcubacteria bacterium]|jgi:16S rRNA (cytidine1402-2'-O)-methyltransferase
MTATLYIVPTPIGNLEDMTYRAVRILKEVDTVFCEDTSVTQRLFKEYGIETKTSVFHANSSERDFRRIIEVLQEGKDIALVSDAGMPTISDPGVSIVKRVYEEVDEVQVIALPGATALTTALAVSGISSATFTFFGFLPQKKGRETVFGKITLNEHVSAFYESVHRIEKTLDSLKEKLEEGRTVVVCKELSKMHEEVVRGTAAYVAEYFALHKDKVRGEFVVIVEGKR